MRQVQRHHVIYCVPESFVTSNGENDEDENNTNNYVAHEWLELFRLGHAGVDVQDDAIALEVEDRDTEE